MKVRFLFPAATIILSMALSACAVGAHAAQASPTPDPQKAMLAWAQCMREHGVNLPDPGSNGSGAPVQLNVDQATMDAAQKACRSKLKGQDLKQPSAAQQAQMRDALVKYSQCMRAHGIDMPDPQFSGSGGIQRLGGDIDPNSAEFQAANKACQKNLPGKGALSVRSGSGGASSVSGGQ